MILKSIQLKNFRTFYNETPEIIFSYDDKPINLIVAENGDGKTTLLNAFTWAMYDQITSDVENPKNLISYRAINEAKVGDKIEAWVKVKFVHDETTYVLERSLEIKKENEGIDQYTKKGKKYPTPKNPILQNYESDGRWKKIPDAFAVIDKILPLELHNYFFFNGERMNEITNNSKEHKKKLASAIKKLLGVDHIYNAIEHTKKAKKYFNDEMKANADAEALKKLEILNNLKKQLEIEKGERNKKNSELEKVDKEIAQLGEQRLKNDASSKLQGELNTLEGKLNLLKDNNTKSSNKLNDTINNEGYLLFLEDGINDYASLMDDLRKRKEIPAPLKKPFVRDLLESKKCICGRSLDKEISRDAYNEVSKWEKKAGSDEIETSAHELTGRIKNIEEDIPKHWDLIKGYISENDDLLRKINEIEKNIRYKKEELTDLGGTNDDVGELNKKADELDDKQNNLLREIADIENDIDVLDKDIEEAEKEAEEAKKQNQKYNSASINHRKTSSVLETFDFMLERFEKHQCSKLQGLIQKKWDAVSQKAYKVVVDENFSLSLKSDYGNNMLADAGKSTGEGQVLMLCFLSSIIDLTRQDQSEDMILKPENLKFPFVADSIFGQLDNNYRETISKEILALADQTILGCSSSQYSEGVKKMTKNKLGSCYIFKGHQAKVNKKDNKSVEINGTTYMLKQEDENQFTEVIKVP